MDPLPITLEEWSKDGASLTETVGRLSNALVARAAYEALVELRPRARIMLRHGARVLRDSAEDEAAGSNDP